MQVYGLGFTSNLSEPYAEETLRETIKEYLQGVGPLAEALASQGVLYYQTPLENIPNYSDMEISIGEGNASDPGLSNFQRWKPDILEATSKPNKSSSFSLYVTPLRTYSKGWIRLRSSNPYEYPLINPNTLSDPEGRDMRITYEGIQFILNLVNNTKAFRSINATFAMKPIQNCSQHEFLTKDYWYCAFKYITAHNNHPVSTCMMGPNPDDGDVVDYQLRVHGVKKLRVADASIIPISTSSHINAMCIMIGEKGADIIKHTYKIKN